MLADPVDDDEEEDEDDADALDAASSSSSSLSDRSSVILQVKIVNLMIIWQANCYGQIVSDV